MARIDLKFLDTYDSNYIQVEAQNNGSFDSNYIVIRGFDSCALESPDLMHEVSANYSIYLDKSTAIKFAKTLRTEINKIEEEGSNG